MGGYECICPLVVLACESLHVCTVCIWRCEHARFCVEVFYALYINFHSFIHSWIVLNTIGNQQPAEFPQGRPLVTTPLAAFCSAHLRFLCVEGNPLVSLLQQSHFNQTTDSHGICCFACTVGLHIRSAPMAKQSLTTEEMGSPKSLTSQ